MTEEVIIKVDLQGEDSVDKLNKNIENISKNALKASSEVLKMKSAFDVVNASLNTASVSGDKFINKLLSIRFPKIGEMSQKEVKILYQAFTQAEKIGSGMFDMASLAAKVFKGDMNQVNLAIAQYNELFEKNTGVDGITLNTSALLALRNQVIATGSSVSVLNKEISNMATNTQVDIVGEKFKFTEVSIRQFLETAKGFAAEVGANFTITPEAVQKAWAQANEELREYTDLFKNIDNKTVKIGDIMMEIPDETNKSLEGYKTSIRGLQEQVSALTQQYSLLSEKDRQVFGPEILKRIEVQTKALNEATVETNRLGISALRGKNSGFDPLSNSIMQLGRELPNFAISANIGFMAISNNLPILADAISQFKKMREEAILNGEEVPKMGDKIRGSLFSLGGAVTVLAGLFLMFGDKIIKGVVDWLNKIPESVKVKIDIDNEVFKSLEKDLININKFVNDYRKASKDGNKERLEELEKFGKKEYDLNDARLKQIRDTTEGWKTAFKEYLKIAEDTYWNEAIIKKRVEAQQTGEKALQKAIQLFKSQSDTGFMSGRTAQMGLSASTRKGWTWGQLVEAARKNDWAGKTDADIRAFGVPQQIIDELRTYFLQLEIVKSLPKLRDADLKTGVEKPSVVKKPEVSLYKSLGLSVIKEEADRIARESFTKPLLDAEIKYTNEELVIMDDNNKRRVGIYDDAIEDQIDYVKRREDAIQKDLNNELVYQYGQKALLQEEVNRFDTISSEYDTVIADLNTYNKNRVNLLNTNALIEDQINKSKNQKDIEALNKQKQTNLEAIQLIDQDIAAKQLQKTALEAQLKEFEGYPEKMAQITAQIAQLNVAITDSLRVSADTERAIWDARISMAKDYLDAISNVAGGLADIAQGNMDLINAEYDRKIWANDEMIQSDEQRADNEYKIEMARWEALQKNFEMQKKMKEAQAWMDFASGSVGIWTAPGITSLAPFGHILAGIQQAALLATTIGNVKSIRSQQMLKPHKSNGGSASGSSSINIPINPAKNALTSRDENLNTMAKANQKDSTISVVKVSEINDVQNKVEVREKNSSY